MMISDQERRAVARRLRKMPCDIYELEAAWKREGIETECHDQTDYYQIHDAILGCLPAEHMHPCDYEELHSRLADLIDRPTCRNIGDDYMFKCSECGAEFEPLTVNGNEYGDVFYTPFKPRFCSVCGAEVVEDD